jgi:hypothetical protein
MHFGGVINIILYVHKSFTNHQQGIIGPPYGEIKI